MNQLPDLCAQRAALTPDRVALRELLTQRTWSFKHLEHNVARLATLLRARGAQPGERVVALCRNRGEFFELLFACARQRVILVPLNWRMPADELRPLIQEASPVLMFCGSEDRATAQEFLDDDTRIDFDDGYASRLEACAPTPPNLWRSDQIWYLLYTSGTTGKPKAVTYTVNMALANYINITQGMAIGPGDVTLNFLPLFHTAGINLVTLPTLLAGGCAQVLPAFDLETCIALLRSGALDSFFGVPAVYQQISTHPDFETLDLSRTRAFGCGGAPLADDLLQRFLKRGARICNGMGMTETGPTAFYMDPENVARKIGSVGKPQLLAHVRLVDAQGVDVPDGETGEVWFAGPGVTPGYYGNDNATRTAFSPDGWLKSGDLARRDEEGYYFVVGRIKDMFISGGENVYPVEVENALASHPDVLEAAVVAIADPRWGEVGCAFILARPGHTLPAFAQLEEWLRERLAAYKVPKRFIAVDDFPRTAAGKIVKHALRLPSYD